MEKPVVNVEKDGQRKEHSFKGLSEDLEATINNCLSKTKVIKAIPDNVQTLNIMQSQTSGNCIQGSFPRRIFSLDTRIAKHITSLDEKFLRRCLELIYISASRAASFNISANLDSTKKVVTSDGLCSLKTSRHTRDLARVIIECPLVAGTGNAVASPERDWIVNRVNGGMNSINILKSPLFRQFGSVDNDVNFGRTNVVDNKRTTCSDFMSSPGGMNICSSQNLKKEKVVPRNRRHGSEPVHKRHVSVSSMNSTCSDHSSSSSSVSSPVSRGILQCTWKAGLPHYVFSIDDHREVYIANLLKAKSANDENIVDYLYTFHSRAGGTKENDTHEIELDLVGQMRVSSLFSLCPNNSTIMETEFVLFGSDDSCVREGQTPKHNLRKSKGLSKKVVEVFKISQSPKRRTCIKSGGMTSIPEDSFTEPYQDPCNNVDTLGGHNLPANLELAAVIVKDHIHNNVQEADTGGWGLKFLKKVGIRQSNAALETSMCSESCLHNTGDCSASMDILVPAGLHGGPRTRTGGPSSLTERWRSGGRCDCGGWDIGCPLTVLKARPSKNELIPTTDMQGGCKSFDLFTQGSDKGAPIMKMVHNQDGLYFVHFQSILSALQSFSIAVAVIHTNSPTLRPKLYRS